MDFGIVWSKQSLCDLREIVSYIARDDRETARRFGDFLISRVDVLKTFPHIGRIVPEFRDVCLREVIVSPYRIVYEIDAAQNRISILRIWHGARGELDLLEER